MDGPTSRLQEDLAGVFRGRIAIDAVQRAAYAPPGAATWPRAVVTPADPADMSALVRYAAETGLPLSARGGATEATPCSAEVVCIDLTRGFCSFEWLDTGTVRVGAGVSLDEFRRLLKTRGGTLVALPSTAPTATVGGWLSTAAALPALRGLEVVLPEGTLVTVGAGSADACGLPTALTTTVSRLLEAQQDLLQRRLPRLDDLLRLADLNTGMDVIWPRLFCGARGRLGLITAVTFAVAPEAPQQGSVLFAAPDLEAALRAAPGLVQAGIDRCTLFDQRRIALAHEPHSPWRDLFSPRAAAALLVEWHAADETGQRDRLQQVLERAQTCGPLEVCRIALAQEENVALRRLPCDLDRLFARHPQAHPLPWSLPLYSVPLSHWETVVLRLQKVLQQHRIITTLTAEAISTALRFRPIAVDGPVDRAALLAEMQPILDAAHAIDGRSVNQVRQDDAAYRGLCHAVQELFDPQRILDPERVSQQPTGNVESSPPATAVVTESPVVALQLLWNPEQLVATATRCNGCGECRSTATEHRMCPFSRLSHDELETPRAKAAVALAVAAGRLPSDSWSTPAALPIVESCFQCGQCRSECPSAVDIPRLMLEARAQRVATLGLSQAAWALTRGPDWMPWLRRITPLLNRVLKHRWGRGLVERLFGITCQRRFPPISSRSFLQQMPRQWGAPPARLNARTVILFVDHYANWHDPELALLAGQVLEHQGLAVHVPPGQRRSGFDLLAAGDLDAARVLAEQNLDCLEEFARSGCPIVCLEPSAAIALRDEYPRLLNHPDAAAVAAQVDELGRYLARLHAAGDLRTDFAPVHVAAAYHRPCHLRTLGESPSLLDLCNLIPGPGTPRIEAGCSGMAGIFGWDVATVDRSLAMGTPLAEAWRDHPARIALSECSSCRLQLEHLTQRPARHPLTLLAEAYGLTPQRS